MRDKALKKEVLSRVQKYLKENTHYAIPKEELWFLIRVIFAVIYTLAWEKGRVCLSGVFTFFLVEFQSGKKVVKAKASARAITALNEENPPDFFKALLDRSRVETEE